MTAAQALSVLVEGDGELITDRIRRDRTSLRELLTAHGTILLRGFEMGGVDGFDRTVRELSGTPLTYAERSSPGSIIKGNVHTSADYPPQEEIFLHNENSYQAAWPLTLCFHCVEPPTSQGAMPLSSTRAVYAAIDSSVREEFERRGWIRPQLRRRVRDAVAGGVQHQRPSQDRRVLRGQRRRGRVGQRRAPAHQDRARCGAPPPRDGGIGLVQPRHVLPHPTPEEVGADLLEMCGEENLPSNTYYGDGGRIPESRSPVPA